MSVCKLQLLLDAGAMVDAEDSEGNTPLHVKCYGESNKPSEMTSIELLLQRGASLVKRNFRELLPIHCCAMQGRVDVMRLMMRHDTDAGMPKSINLEEDKKPPSLLHLSIANDFMECADWLVSNGFFFKEREQDILLRRILSEQIKLALHYAAGMAGSSDILDLLLSYGAEVDAFNEDGNTPLFFATQSDNQYSASALIDHGANYRQKNHQGLTALDYIVDYDEWIDCGYFGDEIKARLKAYNLKHARDLIRAISKKVKPVPFHPMLRMEESSIPMTTTGSRTKSHPSTPLLTAGTSHISLGSASIFGHHPLPPLRRVSVAAGYLTR
ncbi:hypothetical protein KUTeg_023560 [Tegillarca granosa]|uniref:Uncharacterized protein n=1 Tax=Tegillarca granosa TaxID=220873 RepID=A0ABQ9E7M9_TEGGR|nr:hypothetical protein KUTeg_023560 [Tegillarca granosa]